MIPVIFWTLVGAGVALWLLPGVAGYLKSGFTGKDIEKNMMPGIKFFLSSMALLFVGITLFTVWYEALK